MFDTIITIIVLSFETFTAFDTWMRSFAQIFVMKCTPCTLHRIIYLHQYLHKKSTFSLHVNKATLLVTLFCLVVPLSRIFSLLLFRGGGGGA